MKILFIVKSKVMENLGVMYLSTVVKRCGHECKITDINNSLDCVYNWKPDMIGYSIMTGDQKGFFLLNNTIKSHTHITTFAGGPHPTFFPEDPALATYDNVVRGEAEQYFADILQSGIKFPNIDSLRWPDRSDFPNMKIRDFIASRGCPHDCGYCYNRKWAELHPQFDKVRVRSAKDVCDEVKSANPEFAYFQDSCFAINKKWMCQFMNSYCGTPYHCHLRPKQVDEDMVTMLSISNCASIRMALESASDRLRELMNRPKLDTQNVLSASILLKQDGIKFMIQNILAIPTSTIEDDLATLEFNIRCQPDYAWSSIFSPYPGTALGDMCVEKGWYKGDYSNITDSFFDRSVLEFDERYKEQTYVLQKVFALCVEAGYVPKEQELNINGMPKLVHAITRKMGDRRLYRGVI